jgi:NADH dehydrogenase/NADH:ubiquinone oxidoreductase subunit G
VYNYSKEGHVKPSVNIGAVVDAFIDLEGLYALSESLKFYGSSNIQYGNFRLRINADIPNFYTSNRNLTNINKLTALLLIGVNTRYEASLLNTSLRKQQIFKDLSYFYLGAPIDLKMKNQHLGLSVTKLIDLIENKVEATRTLVNTRHSSVMLGVETLKSRNGNILQNLSRFLAKKLFTKTKAGERLGLIHANTASVIFNTLGVSPSVRSNFYVDELKDKKVNCLFAVQPYSLDRKK